MKPETYGALNLAFKSLQRSRSSYPVKVRYLEKAQKHISRTEKYEGQSFNILKRWHRNVWDRPRFEHFSYSRQFYSGAESYDKS